VVVRHRPDPWSVWFSSVWPQVIVFVLCVCFVILCLTFLDHPRQPEDNWNCNMGQSSFTSSPLQCMLTNFSSFQQKDLYLGASCDAFTLRKLWIRLVFMQCGMACWGDLWFAYSQPGSLHSNLIEVLSEKPSWLQKCIKEGIDYSKVLLSTKHPKPSSSARLEDKMLAIYKRLLDINFSAISKHYILCLYLSTCIKAKRVRKNDSRPKWSHLKDTSDCNHCCVCNFIYQCCVHNRQVHLKISSPSNLKLFDVFKSNNICK
jgi:hypothetical protein